MNKTIELIAAIRGGIPEKCDFCDWPLNESNAVPEECGDWACVNCLIRWGDIPHPDQSAGELIPEDGA